MPRFNEDDEEFDPNFFDEDFIFDEDDLDDLEWEDDLEEAELENTVACKVISQAEADLLDESNAIIKDNLKNLLNSGIEVELIMDDETSILGYVTKLTHYYVHIRKVIPEYIPKDKTKPTRPSVIENFLVEIGNISSLYWCEDTFSALESLL